MQARPPRKVTVQSTATLIADTTKPPPHSRLYYYATGGNTISIGKSLAGLSAYADGYPVGAGKPDFSDLDSTNERYAITNTGTQDLYIQEFDE